MARGKVGKVDAALMRDIRRANYAKDRTEALGRLYNYSFPEDIVVFLAQYVAPLRDGDMLRLARCQDRSTHDRVIDMHHRALVPIETWDRPEAPKPAPYECMAHTIYAGAGLTLVEPDSALVQHYWIEIPEDWRGIWPLRSKDELDAQRRDSATAFTDAMLRIGPIIKPGTIVRDGVVYEPVRKPWWRRLLGL